MKRTFFNPTLRAAAQIAANSYVHGPRQTGPAWSFVNIFPALDRILPPKARPNLENVAHDPHRDHVNKGTSLK